MMKVDLKIEAPGVQVYCYALNVEGKAVLQDNFNKMYMPEDAWKMENPGRDYIHPKPAMQIVEEYCEEGRPSLITHGMGLPGVHYHDRDGSISLSIDGKNKEIGDVIYVEEALFEEDLINLAGYDGLYIKGEHTEHKPASFDECLLYVGPDCYTKDERKNLLGSKVKPEIPKDYTLIFEIINYPKGVLTASIEVDDDFMPRHLVLVSELPDTTGENSDEEIYYFQGKPSLFECLTKKYGDPIGFNEDMLRGVLYKGQFYAFELSFRGGEQFVFALENESEDFWDWDHAFLHDSWGVEYVDIWSYQ